MTFIDELLAEAEKAHAERRLEMNLQQANHMLKAVEVLESKMADVNTLADDEIKLIEEYRSRELARLDKQRSWLLFNLESFARSTGEKTIRLVHGVLRLRKGRDRIAVVEIEKFLPLGKKLGLLETVPETTTPNNKAILAYVRRTGEIPPGTEFIPAGTKFSYSTNNNGEKDDNDERQPPEGGDSTE